MSFSPSCLTQKLGDTFEKEVGKGKEILEDKTGKALFFGIMVRLMVNLTFLFF